MRRPRLLEAGLVAGLIAATVFAAHARSPRAATATTHDPAASPQPDGGESHYPLVAIGTCVGAVTIDAKLDEPAWQQAAQITGFMAAKTGFYGSHQPLAWLAYDNERLYLAVRSPLRGDTLRTEADRRDDDLSGDDCIEFHLDTTPDTIDYYSLVINSKGVVLDFVYNAGNRIKNIDKTWDLHGMTAAARVEEEAWVLEVSLPFGGLGLDGPPRGGEFLFNLCETRQGSGAFAVCAGRSYHTREKFGRLVFAGEGPRVRLGGLGPLSSGLAEVVLSHAGAAREPGSIDIVGERFDETADTFFGTFTATRPFTEKTDIVFRSREGQLGKNGIIVLRAKVGGTCIYEGRIGYETMSAVEIETMRVVGKPGARVLKARACQPFLRGAKGHPKVRVSILDANGAEIRCAEAEVVREKMDVLVDIEGVAPGPYQVALQLTDGEGGVTRADHTRDLVVYPDPTPWAGNTLGISEKVPPPWSPMRVRQKEAGPIIVECWNREYSFGPESLLPGRIVTGCRDCLKSPIRLEMRADGAPLTTAVVSHRVVTATDRRVRLDGAMQTPWGIIGTETTIEFDGFIWIDLKLAPARTTRLDALSVVVEMSAAQARLLHSGFRTLDGVGSIPRSWSKNLDCFQGPFWVGAEHGGLSFAVESFQNWSNKDVQRQATVDATDAGARIALNIVDVPLNLQGAVGYGLGIQPTPVRPRPQAHRTLRPGNWMGALRTGAQDSVNFSYWNNTALYRGTPDWLTEQRDLKWLAKLQDKKYDPKEFSYRGMRESGARSTWYSTYSSIGRNCPECVWAGEEWRTGPVDQLYGNSLRGYYEDLINVCKTRDFQDYFLWRLDKTKRERPVVDGIYFDLIGWKGCQREDHGHGYVSCDGRRAMTWPLRDHREWLMRVYTYLKQADSRTPVLLHLSGQEPKIMGYAFCDYLYDGELWIEQVQSDRSYENISLPTFRASMLGEAWGPSIIWISQLGRAINFLSREERKEGVKPWAYRHLLAMQLVHDSPMRLSGQQGVAEIWKLMEDLGFDDSWRMAPYWEPEGPISLTPPHPEIVATGYSNAQRALVVVFNNTGEDRELSVAIDMRKLFGPAREDLEVRDAESGKTLGSGPRLTLPVGMRNFRLLVVGAKEPVVEP